MTELRVGLVGFGIAGAVFHAPLIAANPDLQLTAVVTRDADKRARIAADYPGTEVVDDVPALLARGDLDLVVVASPNRAHGEHARAALEAGLPVVVDKPFVPTSLEARQLVEHAKSRGLLLTVYQNRRWDGDFRTVAGLVDSGELGRVHRFESRIERWSPTPKPTWRDSGGAEDVAGLLYDYYTLADLKKLQKDFDASERAIAEIYHAKTGLEVDQLRSMMTRETWMVGQEAIDNGFADTLLTDEGPDVTLSADKKVLLVAGIRHDVKGFRHIPGTIPIDNSIHAAPAAGNKHAAAKNDGPKKEDNKTMTLEEMRAQHPDVVAQIEQQAAETARTQERARIEAIDSIAASVGDAQLVRDAKYGETPCTAEQLALKAMQKQAALGAKHLKDAKADNDESGAAGVGAAPNGGEEGSESDDKAKVDAIVGLYNSTKSQNGGKK